MDLSGNNSSRYKWVKRSHLTFWFCRIQSNLVVSIFQGSSPVTVIMIDGSRKHKSLVGFWAPVGLHPQIYKPDKLIENATFSLDRPCVYTKPDKFENGVFVAKMDKTRSVHIIVFEEIATEFCFCRPHFLPTHHFVERFQKVLFSVTENSVLVWMEGLSGEKKRCVFKFIRLSVDVA